MIGSALTKALTEAGHHIKILTRNPRQENHVKWNPDKRQIDLEGIKDTQVIINLCGASIADKRWTSSRKKELIDSRVKPAVFILELSNDLNDLEHYITVSGINCYGFKERAEPYSEEDAYGTDFTSQLVKKWEEPAKQFPANIRSTVLRLAIVLTDKGGALPKMVKPFNMGVGSGFGSGKQIMSWVTLDELMRVFDHIISRRVAGTYNVCQGNPTNLQFMKALGKHLNKKLLPVNVPAATFKIIFGQMSEILLQGVPASNQKLIDSGFTFKTDSLSEALRPLDL